MTALPSYVAGRWTDPADEGVAVHDAATGEEVARLSTSGIDMGGAVRHAREVGGPALRELTFTERAGLLKDVVKALAEHRDELFGLSTATGATRADSKVDIDGGTGTTHVLAATAAKQLPDAHVWPEGEAVPLSRDGGFVAQHVLTPRRGVAVQVNAYNFPVWGMLEKFAPAFVAGVPSIVKPASDTAYLTHRLVERMLDTGLLPEGSLQILCGSPGDLLDHLDGQDSLLFTGSATTAATLRSHPNVVARAVRVNAEADSLNCAILGPDATPDTPEFDLFVDEVAREMTTKAGQRCTCIRRAIVPEGLADAVAEAVTSRLADVRIGHPASPEVTMGALVSTRQRDDVRDAVRSLSGAATIATGQLEGFDVVDGDPEVGAFLPPVLLRADDPEAPAIHEVEAFGPVSTIVGYRDVDHAAALARRGEGSLVGSLFTADGDVADAVLGGIGSHHGRLLVVDRDCGDSQTGHGTPMPQTVHGGPGRAGGGEELGGMRAVEHFLQRTAVQGSAARVAAMAGG
jgi:oxepin-CoA hydrolase/3-oxo-5,6-dehydrosuberyl-CoA semialdehyde dehydrogenase